jgi:hypothetical protein
VISSLANHKDTEMIEDIPSRPNHKDMETIENIPTRPSGPNHKDMETIENIPTCPSETIGESCHGVGAVQESAHGWATFFFSFLQD